MLGKYSVHVWDNCSFWLWLCRWKKNMSLKTLRCSFLIHLQNSPEWLLQPCGVIASSQYTRTQRFMTSSYGCQCYITGFDEGLHIQSASLLQVSLFMLVRMGGTICFDSCHGNLWSSVLLARCLLPKADCLFHVKSGIYSVSHFYWGGNRLISCFQLSLPVQNRM